MNIKPFCIKTPKSPLDNLHESIKKSTWPAVIAGQHYGGSELATIKDLACNALSLPLQDLSFANFTDIEVKATDPGIYPADA